MSALDEQTERVIRQVADQAARQAVTEVLTALGLDPKNPIEAQRDMATLRLMRDTIVDEDYQRDMLHLRRWRRAMDSVQDKSLTAAAGILTSGILAALYLGFTEFLKR